MARVKNVLRRQAPKPPVVVSRLVFGLTDADADAPVAKKARRDDAPIHCRMPLKALKYNVLFNTQ